MAWIAHHRYRRDLPAAHAVRVRAWRTAGVRGAGSCGTGGGGALLAANDRQACSASASPASTRCSAARCGKACRAADGRRHDRWSRPGCVAAAFLLVPAAELMARAWVDPRGPGAVGRLYGTVAVARQPGVAEALVPPGPVFADGLLTPAIGIGRSSWRRRRDGTHGAAGEVRALVWSLGSRVTAPQPAGSG